MRYGDGRLDLAVHKFHVFVHGKFDSAFSTLEGACLTAYGRHGGVVAPEERKTLVLSNYQCAIIAGVQKLAGIKKGEE